jgi:hypothetical protein
VKFGTLFGAVLLALAAPALGGGGPEAFLVSARLRWWVPTVDGSFQVNQRDYKGSYEDYRDELNLRAHDPRNNPGVPEAVLEGRLGNSSLVLHWLETSMHGTAWIDRMTFNGKAYVAERVRTDLDLRLYRLTYAKHLLDVIAVKGSLLVGVAYIDYRAEVEPEDPGLASEPTHTGGNAPFPYFGGRVLFRIPVQYVRTFEVLVEAIFSRGDWGDARLFYFEGTAGLSFRPVRFVSVGAGVHATHVFADAINVWSDDPDTLLLTLGGPYFEVEGRF